MQKLQSTHSYLGCIFPPLLLFFAISGIWQALCLHSSFLDWLSGIHPSVRFKNDHKPCSPALKMFVITMSSSFVLTTIPGVAVALKCGRSRKAEFLLPGTGVSIPLLLVLLRILK